MTPRQALFPMAMVAAMTLSINGRAHLCTATYDKALNSMKQEMIGTATLPLWGGIVSALGFTFGTGAIIISPLYFMRGSQIVQELARTGATSVLVSVALAGEVAAFPVTVPLGLAMTHKAKKDIQKTAHLLKELDLGSPGQYTHQLAEAASKSDDVDQFFNELKRVDFCPEILEGNANLKALDGHGVFGFKSLRKIVAKEKRAKFKPAKYARYIRFKSKFSSITYGRRFGLVGRKKVARVKMHE